MKRILLIIITLIAATGLITAQQRYITRGATEGELYLSTQWYCNYGPWGDTLYNAILHITENGKKAEIKYGDMYKAPDAGTGADLPMQIYHIMADAKPGVLYNTDEYMAYYEDGLPYDFSRLWFSEDHGKTWELRDDNRGRMYYYYVANKEGLIYRGGGGVYKSKNFGLNFLKEEGISYWEPCDGGLSIGEVFSAGAMIPYQGALTHTYNDFKTYTQIPIDSQYMYGRLGGSFPDIFRGGKPGEVYITSLFPDNTYKISFSADTGYHFRVVHQRQNYKRFMTDRKAGDFYIIFSQTVYTQSPYGWYQVICIEHYTDYGETLAGTYCHDLTREGVVTAVEEIPLSDKVTIYPNPTTGEIQITNYELRIEQIRIYDVMGHVVAVETQPLASSNQNSTTTIDISNLPAGIYFIQIQTEKGIVSRKIVKY